MTISAIILTTTTTKKTPPPPTQTHRNSHYYDGNLIPIIRSSYNFIAIKFNLIISKFLVDFSTKLILKLNAILNTIVMKIRIRSVRISDFGNRIRFFVTINSTTNAENKN